MGGGILARFPLIMTARDNQAAGDEDRADRHLAHGRRNLGLVKGTAHLTRVVCCDQRHFSRCQEFWLQEFDVRC